MPITENITFPAGDDVTLNFDVAGNPGQTLAGATIKWQLFAERFGVPVAPALIEKDNVSGDGISVINNDALTFALTLVGSDTEDLVGRYYHEAEITFADGAVATVTLGILTITRTAIPNNESG